MKRFGLCVKRLTRHEARARFCVFEIEYPLENIFISLYSCILFFSATFEALSQHAVEASKGFYAHFAVLCALPEIYITGNVLGFTEGCFCHLICFCQ